MEPIRNRDTTTLNGNRLINLTLDPFCFMFNSIALGDVIAAVPVVKHMIETYYTRADSYLVCAKPHFRCLFPFVPDANFVDYDNQLPHWGIPTDYIFGALSRKKEAGLTRNTPKHMLLGQYASINLADRLLDLKNLNYVALEPTTISDLGLPATYAVLITSYRDRTRAWSAEHVLGVASWLSARGITPVFVGKTDMDAAARVTIQPKNALPDDVSAYGLDLRNRTTIPQLASVMANAKVVCGLDSGPIHLAGTTSVPIVCGYTSVSPEFRIPVRATGKTYAIAPELECIGCESRWCASTWNYENCFYGHINCCALMTSQRFINVLATIL